MTTPCNLKPKLILLAILTAYAMPQLAIAENKAEALELSKIEVVGTANNDADYITPLTDYPM